MAARTKIIVKKMCSCCERPKWQQWMVFAWQTGFDHCSYKPVYFEHNYAAVLFAFYVARATPAKIMERI